MVNVVETSAKFQIKLVQGYAEKREGLSSAAFIVLSFFAFFIGIGKIMED